MAKKTDPTTPPKIEIVKMRRDFPLSKMRPYERNPRINDHAVAVIERSLGRFGPVEPIVLDEAGRICCGHTRYKAAMESGEPTFPTIVCRFPTEAEFAAYNVTSNKTGEIADWDIPALQLQVEFGLAEGLDVEDFGFDDDSLRRLVGELSDGNFDPTDDRDQQRLDQKDPIVCPKCGHEFHP